MKVKRKIHTGWIEWQTKMPEELKKTSIFGKSGWAGKYQYIYSSEKGEISLVKLKTGGFKDLFWLWEIYEISANNLFRDVERFNTKKEAVKRITKLLKGGKKK